MTTTQATHSSAAGQGAQATLLMRYLEGRAGRPLDPSAAAFYASLDAVGAVAPGGRRVDHRRVPRPAAATSS